MCAYVWISQFDFTHFIVLIVCMQVRFKPANLHKHMHAFHSGSLSPNYWRNLYARRFLAAIRSSATCIAQNFLSWLASSPPSTAIVISLTTHGIFFSTPCTPLSRRGQLNTAWEKSNHTEITHLSHSLPLSQCISVYTSFAWQWYTRVGSKSQRKCNVSICMCGYERSTKKVHSVNPSSAEAIPPCIVGVFASTICMTYSSPLVLKY